MNSAVVGWGLVRSGAPESLSTPFSPATGHLDGEQAGRGTPGWWVWQRAGRCHRPGRDR